MNKIAYIITCLIASLVCLINVIVYYIYIPIVFEKRARDINIMKYNAKTNSFIPKDSIQISSGDVYYLQHGTVKGYNSGK